MPSVLERLNVISRDLAGFVSDVAERDFRFYREPKDGCSETSYNKEVLWMPEALGRQDTRIDLNLRCDIVEFIIDRWKTRLRSYEPFGTYGFLVYVYRVVAPNISVLAGWPENESHWIVKGPSFPLREVLLPLSKGYFAHFFEHQSALRPRDILKTIERAKGSISTATARQLGISGGELRQQIECWDICEDVNSIRKRFRRRPAQFDPGFERPYEMFTVRVGAF